MVGCLSPVNSEQTCFKNILLIFGIKTKQNKSRTLKFTLNELSKSLIKFEKFWLDLRYFKIIKMIIKLSIIVASKTIDDLQKIIKFKMII